MGESIRIPMLPRPNEIDWVAEINGGEFHANIESNAILLDVLRDQAGSLGTKRGCDMGTCGCCSVLVNGKPRLSCLMLAQEANGASITTVEGLANGHHLHPIQETFTTHGGSQCGFCTPGFLVVISALLEANPTPSDPEIKAAIDGNLCRCTGYQQIVDSVRAASEIITSESQTPDPTEAHSDPHPGLAVESANTSTAPQVPEAEAEAPEATSSDAIEPASTQERGE